MLIKKNKQSMHRKRNRHEMNKRSSTQKCLKIKIISTGEGEPLRDAGDDGTDRIGIIERDEPLNESDEGRSTSLLSKLLASLHDAGVPGVTKTFFEVDAQGRFFEQRSAS